jgi:hypothetical protein
VSHQGWEACARLLPSAIGIASKWLSFAFRASWAAVRRRRRDTMCSAIASGTAVVGTRASGSWASASVDGVTSSSSQGPSPAKKPMLRATSRVGDSALVRGTSQRKRTLQAVRSSQSLAELGPRTTGEMPSAPSRYGR